MTSIILNNDLQRKIQKSRGTPWLFCFSWEQRKLGEIVDVRSGKDYKNLPEGNIPVYGTGGYMLSVGEALSYDEDAIGIGRKGTIDKPFVLKAPFWTVDTLFYAVPEENIDLNFAYDIFQNIEWKKKDESTGVPSLSKTAINAISILIPQYEEQVILGRYFAQIDNLITLHQRNILLWSSQEARKTPVWEQRKLSDVIIEYKETVDADCELPVLTSSKAEGVLLQEEHFGRKQNHNIAGYNILPRNYCTYRNRSDGVDFTFNINKCCDKGIISKFYPVFYCNQNDTFFVSLVLNNSDEVVREIGFTCTGTGQKVLSFLDLQEMKIKVPVYKEQKAIANYFKSLDNLITLHQRKPFCCIRRKIYAQRSNSDRLVLRVLCKMDYCLQARRDKEGDDG